MNKKRPINLDLRSLKYPPMAIVSILHRVSGVVIFILLPIVLFMMSRSLNSEASFTQMENTLTNPGYKLVLWLFAASFIFHTIAGARHMIMDLGYGEELSVSRRTAVAVIVLSIISTLLLGIWIW
ncbi:MAG: succinate dehydrogenase, cytochrome b556 subunit [Legionella sp.]|nr:succinate dehydrogenase, cytochrome b556 subunit [Legionella sp.]